MTPETLEALISLGGFTGLGSMIAAIAAVLKLREVKRDTTELRPNHGSSIKDAIRRIEESVRSVGHQVGEVRTDLADERRDRRAWDETLSDRLQTLEQRE